MTWTGYKKQARSRLFSGTFPGGINIPQTVRGDSTPFLRIFCIHLYTPEVIIYYQPLPLIRADNGQGDDEK